MQVLDGMKSCPRCLFECQIKGVGKRFGKAIQNRALGKFSLIVLIKKKVMQR